MAGFIMKPLKQQFQHFSAIQVFIFLLVFGLFIGILCANVFKEQFETQMNTYKSDIFPEIAAGKIDHPALFRYVLVKNYSDFIVFWLLSITILGLPYMAMKVTSFGFFSGFFISAVTMHYGGKGMLLILAYLFPHGLLYLPIALISLLKGYELCNSIYHDNRTRLGEIARQVRSRLSLIVILASALFIASFLEAYIGAFLLKKALGVIS